MNLRHNARITNGVTGPFYSAKLARKGTNVIGWHRYQFRPSARGPSIKNVPRSATPRMSGDKVRDMVIRAGADDFIPKPFQAQDAIRKLKAILDQP